MKRFKTGVYRVAALAAVCGLFSCSDDNPWFGPQNSGGIRLSVNALTEIADGVPVTRADGDLFTVPDVADFSVKLEKIDGSYSSQWTSLAEFEAEKGFPTGAYNITAFYGSPEEEGIEKPYFIGTARCTVLEDREVEVGIEAAVANTLVSVDYTDAFKSYFKSWSADVHSAGHAYNSLPADEARPVFVAPGSIDITVNFTDRQNRSAGLQAASFEALARHHYHVTVDVNNGNVGTAQLVISFDDSIEAEDVYIDLTDELFSQPAPVLTAEGFAPGDMIEFLDGSASGSQLKFNAMARAGIKSAVLTVASDSFTPTFGKEIDLCQATPTQQSQLTSSGVKATGLYKNPGVFGIVDITGMAGNLPTGKHTVTLLVKDKYNRVSEPVSVTFSSEPVSVEVTVESSPSILGSNETVIPVTFNGGDPAGKLTFKVMNSLGAYVDAPIIKTEKAAATRSLSVDTWNVTLRIPETDRNPIPVKIFYADKEYAQTEIRVVTPEFTAETDPLATKLRIRVHGADAQQESAILRSVIPVLTGGDGTPLTFSRDNNAGYVTVNGLKPATQYALTLRLGETEKEIGSFTTESTPDVPNGNFKEVSKIEYSNLVLGGSYKVSPVTYTHHTSISREVPRSWATLNDLTCWPESSNKNTWFMVPSTFVVNDTVVIRSVGYSHAGTTPTTSGGAFNTKYYCENAPASLDRSAGELFLGEYTFAGGRTDGIAFSSRPTSVSFSYLYVPYGSEEGQVSIAVYDAQGNVIASKTENLTAARSGADRVVTLPEYPFGKKAAKLTLLFRSTAGNNIGLNIPSGSALNEGQSLGNKTTGANSYKAFASGSELKVLNVKLNY